jgi:hypothetical protein
MPLVVMAVLVTEAQDLKLVGVVEHLYQEHIVLVEFLAQQDLVVQVVVLEQLVMVAVVQLGVVELVDQEVLQSNATAQTSLGLVDTAHMLELSRDHTGIQTN